MAMLEFDIAVKATNQMTHRITGRATAYDIKDGLERMASRNVLVIETEDGGIVSVPVLDFASLKARPVEQGDGVHNAPALPVGPCDCGLEA